MKRKLTSLNKKVDAVCLCGELIPGTLQDYINHSKNCEAHKKK